MWPNVKDNINFTFSHQCSSVLLFEITRPRSSQERRENCLYMNVPVYLVAQNVHGHGFTTPIKNSCKKHCNSC